MPARKKTAARKTPAKTAAQVIGTRAKITLDQSRNRETLTLETPAGLRIVLSDGQSRLEIDDGLGNSIRLDPFGITINAASKVTINAAAEAKINAPLCTVDSPVAKFAGVVQCQTLISNSVVSASYTPGAGNIF